MTWINSCLIAHGREWWLSRRRYCAIVIGNWHSHTNMTTNVSGWKKSILRHHRIWRGRRKCTNLSIVLQENIFSWKYDDEKDMTSDIRRLVKEIYANYYVRKEIVLMIFVHWHQETSVRVSILEYVIPSYDEDGVRKSQKITYIVEMMISGSSARWSCARSPILVYVKYETRTIWSRITLVYNKTWQWSH